MVDAYRYGSQGKEKYEHRQRWSYCADRTPLCQLFFKQQKGSFLDYFYKKLRKITHRMNENSEE